MENRDTRLDDNADSQIRYMKEVLTSGRHLGTRVAKKVLDSLKLPANKNNIVTATKTLMGKPGIEEEKGFFNPGSPDTNKRIAEALSYLTATRPSPKLRRGVPIPEKELRILQEVDERKGGETKYLFDVFDNE